MQFYPIIYTRTDGCDFCYRAKPRNFPRVLKSLVTEIIFEDDGAPLIEEARRVYYRTEEFLFWGIGLHNDHFVPREISDDWPRPEFGRRLRGFWGGYMEIADCCRESLEYAAQSLLKMKTAVSCDLNDDLKKLSMKQRRVESGPEKPESLTINYRGETNYIFPARMHQHFVLPFWKEFWPPREEPRNQNDKNVISCILYDLRFFALNYHQRHGCEILPTMRPNWTKTNRTSCEDQQEENFWIRLFMSEEEKCVLSNIPEGNRGRLKPIVQSIPEPMILVDEQNNYSETHLEKGEKEATRFLQHGSGEGQRFFRRPKSKKRSSHNAETKSGNSTQKSCSIPRLNSFLKQLLDWLLRKEKEDFGTDKTGTSDRPIKNHEFPAEYDPLEAQFERVKRIPNLKNSENLEKDGF